jgi:hypothetical protein
MLHAARAHAQRLGRRRMALVSQRAQRAALRRRSGVPAAPGALRLRCAHSSLGRADPSFASTPTAAATS